MAAEIGHRKTYLANFTDEVGHMPDMYEFALRNHTNAVMINAIFFHPMGPGAAALLPGWEAFEEGEEYVATDKELPQAILMNA